MAECHKADIPDKIIEDKGFFHCKGNIFFPNGEFPPYYSTCIPNTPFKEFLPTDGDVFLEGMRLGQKPNSRSGNAIYNGLKNGVILKNVVFEDEYISWESDDIVFEDAPIETAVVQEFISANCPSKCCGKPLSQRINDQIFPVPNVAPLLENCGNRTGVDVNPFTGTVKNTGWFGVTLKYYLNIYKRYCCTRNDKDEVIDYDYVWYWSTLHRRDGILCLDDYGPIGQNVFTCLWCYPTFNDKDETGASNPSVGNPHVNFQTSTFMLSGNYKIPVETKE